MSSVIDAVFEKCLDSYGSVPDSVKWKIRLLTTDYTFRIIKTTTFSQEVRKLLGCDTKAITKLKKEILSNGKIMRDLKLYLLQRSIDYKGKCGLDISPTDRRIFSKMAKYKQDQLAKWCQHCVYTNKELDDLIVYCWKITEVRTRKFVYRKMRFIFTYTHHTVEDICHLLKVQMMEKLLFDFHNLKSELHAKNFANQIIRNMGHNFIESNATQKNTVLVTEGEKSPEFNHLIKTLSLDFNGGENNISDTRSYTNDNLLTFLSVFKFRSRIKDKYKLFLDLVLGLPNEEFTSYLRRNRITTKSNDCWQPDDIQYKFQVIAEFIGVSKKKTQRFQEKLQTLVTA